METELRTLVDRAAIRWCIETLARGEDRRDAQLIGSCWWPDATYDFGVKAGSFDEYLDWVVPGSDAIANTQHVLGQSYIVPDANDHAKCETHVLSYHRIVTGKGDTDMCIGGRYLDNFERREGEWRIARRIMLYDWCNDWGPATDWASGLMGQPFPADHYAGRASGDFSEHFFATVRP